MSRREAKMQQIVGGDTEKLSHLREIDAWFPYARELNKEAFAVRSVRDEENKARCFPNNLTQPTLAVVPWAMMEVESPDPCRQFKLAVFHSHIFGLCVEVES